jgi:hypothetical protein
MYVPSLAPGWIDMFYSYLIFKNLSIIGEFENAAPKIGEFQIGSIKQNGSAVAVLIKFQ